ncbi:MAG: hypothetical protein DME97_16820 [Verrucomicrobia bacterium]|nr:MAG: hypothetical protein DME97_16820 [Verrucomicrobiota bacterium]
MTSLMNFAVRLLPILFLALAATPQVVAEVAVTLDDHSQRPYYDAPATAFDYASSSTVSIVTGTPNWPYNNVGTTNVRIIDDQGRVIISGINIPQGTPQGTTVYTITFFGSQQRFDAIGTPTSRFGFPHHIETYYGDPNPYVGDARGGGWAFTYTKSGNGGFNGCNPVCGSQKSSGGDQIWTVYAGPAPAQGTNLTCTDERVAGNQPTCTSCGGGNTPPAVAMARYSIHAMLVSLNIQDTPLRYSPAYGPAVNLTVTYNQKDTLQPSTFTYSNLGPKWTFGWLSYVSDDPTRQLPLTNVYMPGGGAEVFGFDSVSQTFRADPQSHAVLVKINANRYERWMPDGSKQVFEKSDGATSYPRRIFMTEMYDPANNRLAIEYDTNLRVTKITDALLKETLVSYELTADPYKITKITDPFGRFATFEYTNGQLTKITDEIGIQSSFTYASGTDSIASLTTPYGPTTFISGQDSASR